jgi:hypothetical protein
VSLIAAVATFGTAILAALLPAPYRALRRAAGGHYATRHQQQLIRREPGLALAACDDHGYITDCETDDHLPADGAWTKYGVGAPSRIVPGSLGPHPEGRPDLPGKIRCRKRHIDRLHVEIEAQLRDAARRGAQ